MLETERLSWDTFIRDEDRERNDNPTYALRGLQLPYRATIGPYDPGDKATEFGYAFWYSVRAHGHTAASGPAKTALEAQHSIVVQLLRWEAITPEQIEYVTANLPEQTTPTPAEPES